MNLKSNSNIENNIFYTCPYCNENYDTPDDMARCILSCKTAILAKEAEERREKLVAEKENRKSEIYDARKRVAFLESKYIEDYGENLYTYRTPYTKNVRFNGDWGKFFEDCFK